MNKPALLSMDEALEALLAAAVPVKETETVSTFDGHGRVLAQAVKSTLNVPPADNTSMDGYAVRSADTVASGAVLKVAQRIPAGTVGTTLEAGTAARIFTGALIPPGADAVVMQESTQAVGTGDEIRVTINEAVKAGQWVRYAGEDIKQGSEVLSPGARLSPQACGLAASVGLANLTVARRLKVAVFFTGDELAMPGEPLKPGAIYNSNRFMLRGLIEGIGCACTDFGIVRDTLDETRRVLREAAREHDLIITTGGVSVGEEDHVRPAVEAEGEIKLWQISMKPGKPLAYGKVRRPDSSAANFIGLPGNPVSSFVTFLLFVRPFILKCQGVGDVTPKALQMRADFDWPKPDRRREFMRARMNAGGGLNLFPNQSSGVLTSTVWGDGLVDTPSNHTIKRGDLVRFLPFSELLS
ncbi:MAG TPA: gephyrin-like molybdotransferase Glp [Burkholderiales bacterium]|jgi:molybdopterin molybdotransferase